jgi:hypothetical protein
MTVRKMRIVCWLLAAVCTVAAVAVVVLVVLWPASPATGGEADDSPVKKKAPPKTTPTLTMAEFEPLLSGRLRPAPPAPPPQPEPVAVAPIVESAPVPPPAPQGPPVNLVGTVLEAGHNYAMFETETGLQIRKVGESVGGATVEQITDGVAVLKRDGQATTLQVPRPPQQ